jgi:DnaJ-class molecular chaperone
MAGDLILTCPACNSKYNGRNITHTHTSGEIIDDRFLECRFCHGQGALTCETCGGTGRVVMRDGVQVGVHARPATMNMLGPRKMR